MAQTENKKLLIWIGVFLGISFLTKYSVAFLIAGLAALLFSRREKQFHFIGIGILTTILLFFLLKGKAYYVLGLFSFPIAFGAYFIEKNIRKN